MGIRPNLLAGIIGKASGGGYVAKAVHFDGNTWLLNSTNLGLADSPYLTWSAWFYQAAQGDLGQGGATAFLASGDSGDSFVYILDSSTSTAGFGFDFGNTSSSTGINVDTTPFTPAGEWFHLLLSCDLTNAAPNYAAYINDVAITFDQIARPDPPVGGFNNPYSTVPSYTIGVYNGGSPSLPSILGDCADFQFWGTAKIVQSDNTILTADRRNFISASGKPVNPSTAATAYGQQAILLSGDHTTFPTNQGTGGAFTLTGTLTNAATHP